MERQFFLDIYVDGNPMYTSGLLPSNQYPRLTTEVLHS